MPEHLAGQHFGATLRSYVLYQHPQCQVTQPLLREQLREWDIDLSSVAIDALLSADQESFHAEKDGLLNTALVTVIIPADEIQGFQRIVDTHSSATRTGVWLDRGQFDE